MIIRVRSWKAWRLSFPLIAIPGEVPCCWSLEFSHEDMLQKNEKDKTVLGESRHLEQGIDSRFFMTTLGNDMYLCLLASPLKDR